ncbi:DEAD/DEAH box helicase [Deltaproteobacteria bacterium]|nr:DEAD/DEAH box helicase [Deltaproteobacteria bacterium]
MTQVRNYLMEGPMYDRPNSARVAHTFLLRLAEAPMDDELLLDGVKPDNSDKLFSPKTRTMLFKGFGRQGLQFFDYYKTVYRTFLGYPPPEEGLYAGFFAVVRLIRRKLQKEDTINQFGEHFDRLKPLLKRLDSGATSTNVWRQVSDAYSKLILSVVADQDIYLIEKKMPGTGGVPWMALWVMPKKQQELERIRHDDPDLYARLLESKDLRKKIDNQIQKQVLTDGLKLGRMRLRGRTVITGKDPKIEESDTIIYDDDGDRLTVPEFLDKLDRKRESMKALRRVNLTDKELDSIRTLPADVMTKIMESGRPVRYRSLTDDPNKSTALTRIYPVIEVSGSVQEDGAWVNKTMEVVASGKYRGMALKDLVNRAGRQIEGSIFDYNPKTGRSQRIEVKNPDGTANIRIQREPYATKDKKGLLLNIPGARHFKTMRGDLRKLAKLIPSIKLESVPGTQQLNVRFDPKDFNIIREKLGGMAMSNKCMNVIKDHFEELAKNDMATADENLKYYAADKLGGFGDPWPGHGDGLTIKQKEALAWLDSNGNKGVCALDTGMGKTVTSIAIMQKLQRDGLLDDPKTNGRFLYVCPAALTGNFIKEASKFLIDPDALKDRTDVKSYDEFRKLRGSLSKVPLVNPTGRKKFETKWVPTKFGEDYVAIFFDEAQALKNPESQRSMAASSLNHPRKILMTASPMERSPQEVYSLQAISNNIDLTTKEAKRDRNQFMRRFAETVGGRIVGIRSDDPVTARDFRVWVKQNLYFASKTDPKAIALPDLIPDGGSPIVMPPEIEEQYRAVTKTIAKELKEAAKKFKGDPRKMSLAMESLKVKLGNEFAELGRLANIPNWEFEDVPAPTAKKPDKTKRVWKRIPGVPNPKMDAARGIIEQKLAIGPNNLTLMFTDSPEMATESGIRMSNEFPGRSHIVGYSSKIEVWANGEVVAKFGPRAYEDPETGSEIEKGEWKVHVLLYLSKGLHPVSGMPLKQQVASATLTSSYAVGQNLQMYSTVVHLDRDTWNSETMKQRTARAWRAGQDSAVEEYTLDAAYGDSKKKSDQTLDDVRKVIQDMDTQLFDDVVVDAQSEVLGEEWNNMKKNESALHEVNRRMMEQAMSPYLTRMGEESV